MVNIAKEVEEKGLEAITKILLTMYGPDARFLIMADRGKKDTSITCISNFPKESIETLVKNMNSEEIAKEIIPKTPEKWMH